MHLRTLHVSLVMDVFVCLVRRAKKRRMDNTSPSWTGAMAAALDEVVVFA